MKRNIMIILLLLCAGVAGYTFYTAWKMQDSEYLRERTMGAARMIDVLDTDREFVNLDAFSKLRPKTSGTREIMMMVPIAFDAVVRKAPEEVTTSYLYEAFGVIGLDPMPAVKHRMFVQTPQGEVIPVYVWNDAVADFKENPTSQRMVGFHVYTYSKGAAIVVDGVI